jgi:hypothetical protein
MLKTVENCIRYKTFTAANIGFCARLAGRCPAQAVVILLGICSGLDKLSWAFICYLQL